MPLIDLVVKFIMIEHFLFLVLEMFAFESTIGKDAFKKMRDAAGANQEANRVYVIGAASIRSLAKNMGLYNGFLAAGLAWSLHCADPALALALQKFFVTCVVVAGVVGAMTAKKTIFWVQAFPALVALWLMRAVSP